MYAPLAETAPIRVYVVESHVLFGKALCHALAMDEEIDVMGDAPSITRMPLGGEPANVIVVDLDGHDTDFHDTMKYCREHVPDAHVCALSSNDHSEVLQRCLSAGADGYVLKDITPAELIHAVKTIASGSSYVDPRLAGDLLRRRTLLPSRPSAIAELTVRETELVRLIGRGMSNKEISSALSLSEKTVKNHISRIFAKLRITSRSQAAVYAIKTGII